MESTSRQQLESIERTLPGLTNPDIREAAERRRQELIAELNAKEDEMESMSRYVVETTVKGATRINRREFDSLDEAEAFAARWRRSNSTGHYVAHVEELDAPEMSPNTIQSGEDSDGDDGSNLVGEPEKPKARLKLIPGDPKSFMDAGTYVVQTVSAQGMHVGFSSRIRGREKALEYLRARVARYAEPPFGGAVAEEWDGEKWAAIEL